MKYRVQLRKMLWTTVEVEADDEDAAIDAAFDGALPSLCAQCCGWGQEFSVDEGEWDFPDDVPANDDEWVAPVLDADA